MTTQPPRDTVEVMQADREAAQSLVGWLTDRLQLEGPGKLAFLHEIERRFRDFRLTTTSPSSEYARGRADGIEEAAKVAENSMHSRPFTPAEVAWTNSANAIARKIRALSPTPAQPQEGVAPIPMILFCPNCGEQHIDEVEEGSAEVVNGEVEPGTFYAGWDNPPHRSHLCHGCGCIWRPADVATVGVRSIETKGKADNWDYSLAAAPKEPNHG